MTQFGIAFAQFFSMLTTLFSAGNKFAKAAENIGTWTEESSASFADEARITRQQKLLRLNAQTKAIADNPLEDPSPVKLAA